MPQVSSIERALSKKEYKEFEDMVESKNWTIDELVEIFAERGFEFSNTAMGLQKKKILLASESFKQNRILNEALADKLGDDFTASKTGQLMINVLSDLTLESMLMLASGDDAPDPKVLESYAKTIKSTSSASRLNQDYEAIERKRIRDEERENAADTFEKVATENGISKDTAEQIRNQILGVE